MGSWVSKWWRQEIVGGPRGPLLLALVAFVVTFVTTRTITRLIRAGKGPFHNISSSGVHLHHSTPGIILLVSGAFFSVGADGRTPWTYLSAALIGIGASLVLDEFAMIFHLTDVYWSQEGQLSVYVVTLCAATLGLAVVGISPMGQNGLTGTEQAVRTGLVAMLLMHVVVVMVSVLKGKFPTALIGLFLAPVAWLGAARLARPSSVWARHRYSQNRIHRATARAAEFDRRWGPVRERWADFIGGTPSQPNPGSSH